MIALIEDQKKAKEYRKQGKSINEISLLLNKPKSSISYWVRDVNLTIDQKENLRLNNPIWTNAHRKKSGYLI